MRRAPAAPWSALAHPAAADFAIIGRRERGVSAALALLAQLALIFIWLKQTHVDSPWARSGIPDAAQIQYLSMDGSEQGTESGRGARRRAPGPATDLPPAKATPIPPPPDTITQWTPKEIPIEAQKPKPPEPPKPKPLSDAAAEEFKRQWAQLQGDMQKRALDEASHHGMKADIEEPRKVRDSEMAKLRERDKPVQTLLREHGLQTEHTSHQDSIEGSIEDGELCTTGSRGEHDVQIALPCLGDNFVTDFSWYSRLKAPKRGEPSYQPVDPSGRVFVRPYRFAPATQAAFEEASNQLRKLQVTIRMVYLPDLRMPLQLLSRDNRANAIGAEAFTNEAELAEYLRNWADNVRRWTAPRPSGPEAPAGHP